MRPKDGGAVFPLAIGPLGLVFLALLALKVAGLTSVSWWIITAPIWAPVVIAGSAAIVLFVAVLVIFALGGAFRGPGMDE